MTDTGVIGRDMLRSIFGWTGLFSGRRRVADDLDDTDGLPPSTTAAPKAIFGYGDSDKSTTRLVSTSTFTLGKILETLCDHDFTINKIMPNTVIQKYQSEGHTPNWGGENVNKKDSLYITNTLLEENVKFVFCDRLMTDIARNALLRLTFKADSDTHTTDYISKLQDWRNGKDVLEPTERVALNKLYPHLLNLMKALALFFRRHKADAFVREHDPDRANYNAWQQIQSNVYTVWYVIFSAWQQKYVEMEYPQIDIDKIIENMGQSTKVLREEHTKCEEKVDDLRRQWQAVEEKLRAITELDAGLQERLVMSTAQSDETMRQIHEAEDEGNRVRKNLSQIAKDLDWKEPLTKMCHLDGIPNTAKYFENIVKITPGIVTQSKQDT